MSHDASPPRIRRYESYSHEAMYSQVHDGNDPAAAGELAGEWGELAGELRAVAGSLSALSGRSADLWQGLAGEALRGSISTAVGFSEAAAEMSDAVGTAVTEQAENAARARAEMPEPVEYDPGALIRAAATSGDLWQLVGLSDTMADRRAAAEAARRKAIDVLYTRDEALGTAVPAASFPTPPALTGRESAGAGPE